MTSRIGNNGGSRKQRVGGRRLEAGGWIKRSAQGRSHFQHPASSFQLRDRGLTLIEVLVSVVLLAGGGVLVMQALAQVSHALTISQQQSQAYLFALSKMADLELAVREDGELDRVEGRFDVGRDQAAWDVSSRYVADDPQLLAVTLRVVWPIGRPTSERHLETLLRMDQVSP